MDIRYLDNVREDGSYGATTASVAEALRKRGFEVQTSADTQDADGYCTMSFERYVSQWFDQQVMGENEKNQQYVTIEIIS